MVEFHENSRFSKSVFEGLIFVTKFQSFVFSIKLSFSWKSKPPFIVLNSKFCLAKSDEISLTFFFEVRISSDSLEKLGAIISYSIFCTINQNSIGLIITILPVYYALMHYKNSLFQNIYGEEPDSVVLKDIKIISSIFIWLSLYIFLK